MFQSEQKIHAVACQTCGWHKTVASNRPKVGFFLRLLEGDQKWSKCPKCGKRVTRKNIFR